MKTQLYFFLLTLVMLTGCKKNEETTGENKTKASAFQKMMNPADEYLGGYFSNNSKTVNGILEKEGNKYKMYSVNSKGDKTILGDVKPLKGNELEKYLGKDMIETIDSNTGMLIKPKNFPEILLVKVKKGNIYKTPISGGIYESDYALVYSMGSVDPIIKE